MTTELSHAASNERMVPDMLNALPNNQLLKSEVDITLHFSVFQLCSTHHIVLQMKNRMRSVFANNLVATKNTGI